MRIVLFKSELDIRDLLVVNDDDLTELVMLIIFCLGFANVWII
jgi:hypothetical protein